jgi:hypothetical protein
MVISPLYLWLASVYPILNRSAMRNVRHGKFDFYNQTCYHAGKTSGGRLWVTAEIAAAAAPGAEAAADAWN